MAGEGDAAGGVVSASVTGPPAMVTFPDALRNQGNVEPLKLEVEESGEAMSPRNMWQVYALGGFMVLQWLWGRWKERKNRGASA